jgi:hypothetical protein
VKPLFFALIFLAIPLVYAVVIDKPVTYIENCQSLNITVTRQVGSDSYNIKDCTQASKDFWTCPCPSANFSIIIQSEELPPLTVFGMNYYKLSLDYTTYNYDTYNSLFRMIDYGAHWNLTSATTHQAYPYCTQIVTMVNQTPVFRDRVVTHNVTNNVYIPYENTSKIQDMNTTLITCISYNQKLNNNNKTIFLYAIITTIFIFLIILYIIYQVWRNRT